MKIVLLGAVSALALVPVSAATAQAPVNTQPPAAEQTVADREVVVVTGSRIGNPNFESPTPLTSVSTEDLALAAPTQIAEGIAQLPQFQNSVSTAGGAFGPANSQRFGNYLNLRGLGAQRVLVLQDGQRLQSTGNNGGVDATLIPQMLVSQVDVVTGGASAVYGSDAVSGVVNFILDKHMEGLKIQANAGATAGGDIVDTGRGASWRIGVAGGMSFLDDRLHIVASAEHYHTDPIFRTEVPRIAEGRVLVGLGTAASPYYGIQNGRYSQVGSYGFVLDGPLAGQTFTPNGQGLMPYDQGVPTPTAGTSVGGDGTIFDPRGATQIARQTVNQVFIRPEFDFGNDIVGFLSVGYNTAAYDGNTGPPFRRQTVIFADNAYLPASARSQLGSTPSFRIASNNPLAPGQWFYQDATSLRANVGLSGKLFSRFNWDIAYGHDFNSFKSKAFDTNNAKYYAAVDAVRDANGNIVCRVSLTNPGLYPGCQPLKVFGAGQGGDAWYYAMDYSFWTATNKMDDIIATVAGDLFELPAGPLSFAVGAEYRELSFKQITNSPPTVFPAFTGLRGVLPAFNLAHSTLNVGVGEGSENVTEVFGEVSAPVFKDTSFGSLELNAAARVTDYSTSGSVTTWKAGGVYTPLEGLKLRATASRDIRAPTLFELFGGRQQAATPLADQLTGLNGVIQVVSGGNPDLTPEEADTMTAGFVFEPTFVPRLSLSVDYYSIDINQAIALPYAAADILNLCAASNYTGETCAYVERPLGPTNTTAGNFPTAIYTLNQNLAKQTVEGVDLEASYRFNLGPGEVRLHGAANYLIKFDQTTSPTSGVGHRAGNADFANNPLPEWRGTLGAAYEVGGFSVGLQGRYIGSFARSAVQVYRADFAEIPSVWYTDLNASYRFEDAVGEPEFFVVVNNLLDEGPPLAPQLGGPGLAVPWYAQVHDQRGRYVTAGIRAKF